MVLHLMRITLLPQRRCIEISGRRRVSELLSELQILPGTVMVIRGDELVTEHDFLEAADDIEIRNVISGG
jgi:sulfur carrier protein ThiS